jgi:hypothetical protein
MALNKNNLLSLVATNKPDNTTGLITPAKSREVDEQIITANANLEELTTQTFKGPVVFPDQHKGYSQIGIFNSFSTQTGVLDAPTNIEYGAGGTTDNGEITVSSSGLISVNTTGYYSIKQRFRAERAGASAISQVFFWAETSIDAGVSWDVIDNSLDIPLNSSNETVVFFDLSTVLLPAGMLVRSRFARSSTGDDSGDLKSASPSATLSGLGVPDAPSALISIYGII